MRVDYDHTGNATEERFSVDRVVLEPLDWPGNPARPLDDTNLGTYFFEVIDRKTNRAVYSRRFRLGLRGVGHDGRGEGALADLLGVAALPCAVRARADRRQAAGQEQRLPGGLDDGRRSERHVRGQREAGSVGPLIEIEKHGPPAQKIDFLLLGDGYTADERGKFEKDARRMTEMLFAVEPYRSRRNDFNVWALCPSTEESGISRPSTGVHRRSRIGATYDAFGSERYILTFENRSFRDVASFAPYEFVEILTNSRTYGGGGIFGQYATAAADSLWAPYLFVHEFGHHFAALADEYYTSAVAYGTATERVEPWQPNITALLDPAALKWKDLVAPGTPLPTPWPKERFETARGSSREAAPRSAPRARPRRRWTRSSGRRSWRGRSCSSPIAYSGKVGAFEGAMYESKGFYRPQADCIMFTRDDVGFCAVCSGDSSP